MGFFTERLGSIGATIGNIWPGIERANFEKSRIQTEKELAKSRLDLTKAEKLSKAANEVTERERAQYIQREGDYLPFSKKYTESARAAYSADADTDYEKFRGLAWGEIEDKLKPVKLPGGIDGK